MSEYIERTEELTLAMNAGARAIENTKRYHGAIYTKDVFSESPQEIPYLQAAKVLRETSDTPAADVAPVVRCEDCEHAERYERADGTAGYYCGHPQNTFTYGEYWDRAFKPVKEPDDFCSYGELKMDGGADK